VATYHVDFTNAPPRPRPLPIFGLGAVGALVFPKLLHHVRSKCEKIKQKGNYETAGMRDCPPLWDFRLLPRVELELKSIKTGVLYTELSVFRFKDIEDHSSPRAHERVAVLWCINKGQTTQSD